MILCKVIRLSKWRLSRLRNKTSSNSFPQNFACRLSTNTSFLELNRRMESFHYVLPDLVDSLITSFNLKDTTDIANWIKEVHDYNLAGGKLLRGLSTVMAYEAFEKPENITDESLRLSYIMGWCVEMLQANGLMIDDMMDGSVKRRGAPCWYTLPHVGLGATNDTTLMFSSMNFAIRSHFGHLPQYLDLMDFINKVMIFSSVGQHLDYSMGHRDKNNYSKFTIEYYNTIANYKTSYAFMLPICLGMVLANNNDKQTYRKVEEICLKIGGLFQIQDDFIDVFELESVTGKVGTDIQEGKCSWLAVTALQICNDAQRKTFKSCYGSSDPTDVRRIKLLYEELKIPELYRQEERSYYNDIANLANNFKDSGRVTDLFLYLLDFIYNRSR